MDREFRIAAFNQLRKNAADPIPSSNSFAETDWSAVDWSKAGILGDKIRQQFADNKFKYSGAGIGLSVPNTQVIWPGPQCIHPDGSVNILFFFRGGGADVMSKSSTNAIVVMADAGGIGGGASANQFGNASFVNSSVQSIIAQLKNKFPDKNIHLGHLGFTGWSGGYAPIGRILSSGGLVKQPDHVSVLDGIHEGDLHKPNGASLDKQWKGIIDAAKDGKTEFTFVHTAVNPGSYASTTDAANYFLAHNNMSRQPVEQWDGKGKKPDSIASAGNFKVVQLYSEEQPYMVKDPSGQNKPNIPGTAGYQHIQARNSAPDYLPNWA
jgi:hypothetical protein